MKEQPQFYTSKIKSISKKNCLKRRNNRRNKMSLSFEERKNKRDQRHFYLLRKKIEHAT